MIFLVLNVRGRKHAEDKKNCGPQGRSGQVWKISPLPGFDPRTVQPVASRYTDYATRPEVKERVELKIYSPSRPS
jgi:hypothetical protein